MNVVYIAIFGALGSLARYGVGIWAKNLFGVLFPWGTLLVNIVGSFILGFVTTLALENRVSESTRLAIAIGFCGAFTTFSTFELELMNTILEGKISIAFLYILASVLLGLLAMFLGRAVALGI